MAAFDRALREIPFVRRARVGQRVTIGRGYEQLMHVDYPYAALLEFDDAAGLRGYLEHPAHEEIGGAIFASAEQILVYDFEMSPGTDGLSVRSTDT